MFNLLKSSKFEIILFIFSIIHYIIAFHNLPMGFCYNIIKLFSLFFIILLYQLPLVIIKKFKENDKNVKIFSAFFIFFFSVFTIIFIYVHPGRFTMDELGLLHAVREQAEYSYWIFWYHFITSLYYGIILQLFKFKSVIVFVHYSLISAAISYIFTRLYELFKSKLILIPIIIFLLPPVIEIIMCPARVSIYSFVVLFFFALVFIKTKEEPINITNKNLIVYAFLSSIIFTLRAECAAYILLPIMLIYLFRKHLTRKKAIIYLTCFSLLSATIYTIQLDGMEKRGNSREIYLVLPMVYEMERMFMHYNNLQINNAEIEIITKFTPIEKLEKKEGDFYEIARITKTDKSFIKVYMELCKNNFKEHIKSRYSLMKNSNQIHGDFEKEINLSKNKKALCFLNMKSEECLIYNKGTIKEQLSRLYDTKIAIYAILICLLFGILTFNGFYLMLGLLISFHFIFVLFTAPVAFFDYYWTPYLCSLFFVSLLPVQIIEAIKKKISEIKTIEKK